MRLGAVAVVAIVALYYALGVTMFWRATKQKRQVLDRLDGRLVTVSARVRRYGVETLTGTITLDSPSSASLTGPKSRDLRLGELRWVQDATSGERFGGRWW